MRLVCSFSITTLLPLLPPLLLLSCAFQLAVAAVATTTTTTTTTSSSPQQDQASSSPDSSSPDRGSCRTSTPCLWWETYRAGHTCERFARNNGLTLDALRKLNPAIDEHCKGIQIGRPYCVAIEEQGAFLGARQPVSSAGIATATVKAAVDIPTQLNIADSCTRFFYVNADDDCASLARAAQVPQADLVRWNPSIGPDCARLVTKALICVSTTAQRRDAQQQQPPKEAATPTPTPTPTPSRPAAVPTPSPVQPDMVRGCKLFHLVQRGEHCYGLAGQYGVATAQILRWNPGAGPKCATLWANTFACVRGPDDDDDEEQKQQQQQQGQEKKEQQKKKGDTHCPSLWPVKCLRYRLRGRNA